NLSTSTTLQSGCTFTVASNGYLKSAAKTLTALAGCTIVINGGVSINQSSGLYAVSSALIPTTNSPTITLGSASTIEYNNTTAQNIQALNYANLKISGARAANNVVLPSSTIGISGTLDLTGLTFTTGIISVNANSTIDFNNPTGGQTIPALKT
ncbi:MAG: hypothetical protein NTY32_02305, partial [Bacteroidia bacterium]|nr:hypothetical protein [Bacteroidia bacterium]